MLPGVAAKVQLPTGIGMEYAMRCLATDRAARRAMDVAVPWGTLRITTATPVGGAHLEAGRTGIFRDDDRLGCGNDGGVPQL